MSLRRNFTDAGADQYMNLRPFESLLDELLEDLVAHHEAGLAQRKLVLELIGKDEDWTTDQFVWRVWGEMAEPMWEGR